MNEPAYFIAPSVLAFAEANVGLASILVSMLDLAVEAAAEVATQAPPTAAVVFVLTEERV